MTPSLCSAARHASPPMSAAAALILVTAISSSLLIMRCSPVSWPTSASVTPGSAVLSLLKK